MTCSDPCWLRMWCISCGRFRFRQPEVMDAFSLGMGGRAVQESREGTARCRVSGREAWTGGDSAAAVGISEWKCGRYPMEA